MFIFHLPSFPVGVCLSLYVFVPRKRGAAFFFFSAAHRGVREERIRGNRTVW
ncbi:hypothetical protein, unlikely [Trypanosoma brucei gambiense DAL972]|uniref:Uncharacterized protein n=1 Tax=Trypanosoma brucei gambiense (strain MHOM/CI/86/DAL972) TaxID=679716 RepID=C9ZIU0_TRYB9|nr:hypothetical protein, unlikely [Trypanosoma brucei gambiense DAL972]CBH09082.1 hypothetical protein, unlikely [Trypanosoma brucei gambiense DAL972]|eukprot:XP_011771523.1 hypothetical protein, unlikely [Trypanosoma brucei gambiense DAL972]